MDGSCFSAYLQADRAQLGMVVCDQIWNQGFRAGVFGSFVILVLWGCYLMGASVWLVTNFSVQKMCF